MCRGASSGVWVEAAHKICMCENKYMHVCMHVSQPYLVVAQKFGIVHNDVLVVDDGKCVWYQLGVLTCKRAVAVW